MAPRNLPRTAEEIRRHGDSLMIRMLERDALTPETAWWPGASGPTLDALAKPCRLGLVRMTARKVRNAEGQVVRRVFWRLTEAGADHARLLTERRAEEAQRLRRAA
jgi:hypothetical protein